MKTVTFDGDLYQLVPKEPTQAMIASACDEEHRPLGMWPRMQTIYRAMLSAAPTPPAQPAERKPLSEDEIHDMWIRRKCMAAIQSGDLMAQLVHLVRVVESAHGIGKDQAS